MEVSGITLPLPCMREAPNGALLHPRPPAEQLSFSYRLWSPCFRKGDTGPGSCEILLQHALAVKSETLCALCKKYSNKNRKLRKFSKQERTCLNQKSPIR